MSLHFILIVRVKWEGGPFQFEITYLPSNDVYEKDGNKLVKADGHDNRHKHTHAFWSYKVGLLHY